MFSRSRLNKWPNSSKHSRARADSFVFGAHAFLTLILPGFDVEKSNNLVSGHDLVNSLGGYLEEKKIIEVGLNLSMSCTITNRRLHILCSSRVQNSFQMFSPTLLTTLPFLEFSDSTVLSSTVYEI